MRVRSPLPALFAFGFLSAALAQEPAPDSGAGGASSIAPPPAASAGAVTPNPSGTGATTPSGNPGLQAGVLSAGTLPAQAPPTFLLPGGGGFLSRFLVGNEGRFAQPPFRIGGSVTQGYDDNINTTPDEPQKAQPVQTFRVERRKRFTGLYNLSNPLFPVPIFASDSVLVKDKLIQPLEPQPRTGSATTNTSVFFQAQALRPRTAYTFDLNVGSTYYYNRTADPSDYSGSMAFVYLHRISPRMTLSAQLDAVYSSQPDFSRINTPTSQGDTSYISGNGKADLSYQWTPRVSTVASYSVNTTLYQTNEGSNVFNNTLGGSVRYLYSPLTTAVLELRQNTSTHTDATALDSTSTFLLAGADLTLSRRARGAFRIGEELRSTQLGETTTNPYGEMNISYILPRGSTVDWSNRYGFEDPGSVGQTRNSYRTTLALNQVVNTRCTASLGVAYVRSTIESLAGDVEAITEQQLQASLGVNYVLSRRWSARASYTLTKFLSTAPGVSYGRNQMSIGATYSF